ncbi:MAG: chemotaxis protein CheD [Gammaproteobacteria bacterium]|nr:chemotaxis protein CheD [Gammaproteobacteria bacterium]
MRNEGFLTLNQGDIYFGSDQAGVDTLLGSCVAVTLWHPYKKLGGMSHIVLPGKGPEDKDAKYATGAIAYFLEQIKRHHTRPQDYVVHVYGGGKMFSVDEPGKMKDIGNQNGWKTLELLSHAGFRLQEVDLLDTKYRKVALDLGNGAISFDAQPMSATESFSFDRPSA